MDVFRTTDENFENLPDFDFAPNYREVDDLRMHYLDEGGDDPIILFHGEPSWCFLYRNIIPSLVENNRVIAPDLIGFGRSDKPTNSDFYTYDKHTEMISGLLAQLEIENATVVVQDWGGPIGLRWAVNNADKVRQLVILNTGVFPAKPHPGFMAWRQYAADQGTEMPIGQVVNGGCKGELSDEVIAAYNAPFPTPESKAGPAQFPLLVPLHDKDVSTDGLREVVDKLAKWEKPALIIFSDSDPIFPAKLADKFEELIPGALPAQIIEGAGHFLQELVPDQVTEAITSLTVQQPA